MRRQRVLAIGLDGYEPSLGEQLMRAGEMPAMDALRRRSACFRLDHGAAQRTGLAWEHFATALSPEAAGRAAAVSFDPATYAVWQEGTSLAPFAAHLDRRTIVFDAPYFDLARAPAVRGVVNWGAHDPGVVSAAQPDSLLRELNDRVGPYPAGDWIYGIVWHSPALARRMGEALARAVDVRAAAAQWLLAERVPDWDLALVVAGEPHSAVEGLWHGVDPTHPLHTLPSASVARDGLHAVYRNLDRMVGGLAAMVPDAALVVFAMGGMGANRSDVASMVLLPELLYREAFGRPLLRQPAAWNGSLPMLGEADDWADVVNACLREPESAARQLRRAVTRVLPPAVRRGLRALSPIRGAVGARVAAHWQPAARYQDHWPRMRAFALPSYYDGRIRINLAGRERDGLVSAADYARLCDHLAGVLEAARDADTGHPVVESVERCAGADPRALGPTDADLIVVWSRAALAIDHPTLGRVGPIPYRRPGGHTGPYGMAYLAADAVRPGDYGVRSSFDVVPSLIELLGAPRPEGISGRSLIGDPAGA